MVSEDVKDREEKLELFIPNGPRLGSKVLEATNISMAFGDKLLYEKVLRCSFYVYLHAWF